MAADRLREDPQRRKNYNQAVSGGGDKPSRILSVHPPGRGAAESDGVARRNSKASGGDAGPGLSRDNDGVGTRRLGGKSQTSAAANARAQSRVFAELSFCRLYDL